MIIQDVDSKFFLAVGILVLSVLWRKFRHKSTLLTLPGPSGWPIVGNLLQLGEDAAQVRVQAYMMWRWNEGDNFPVPSV
jgi:hypothetical protein